MFLLLLCLASVVAAVLISWWKTSKTKIQEDGSATARTSPTLPSLPRPGLMSPQSSSSSDSPWTMFSPGGQREKQVKVKKRYKRAEVRAALTTPRVTMARNRAVRNGDDFEDYLEDMDSPS